VTIKHTNKQQHTFFCDGDGEDVAGRAAAHAVQGKHAHAVGGRAHLDERGLRLVRPVAPEPLHGVPRRCGRGRGGTADSFIVFAMTYL